MIEEDKIGNYISQNTLDMTRVVNKYYNYVSTIIRNSAILSIEDEEEIISDVFFIIWKNRDKLDKKAKFSPYIAGVTKKVMFRKFSEQNKKIQITNYENDIVAKFDINNVIEERELNECIIQNLKKMGKTEYEIFTKFYYEGKKVKEIAKEMGLSASNVKVKLHRTREKIKEFLKVGGFKYE